VRAVTWILPVALVVSGCAARVFTPPAGPETPFADAPAVWSQVTASCRDAQRYVAEMRVHGWVGNREDGRISRTLAGAVTRNDDMVLEMQIMGATAFQMAGQNGQATFMLPRDERVLRAPTREIVAALTGLQWGGRELLDVLTGCVSAPEGEVTGARVGALLRVDLSPATRAWLRERAGQWQLAAAQVGDWVVEYGLYDGRWPRDVRVTSAGATPLDLRFTLSGVNVNIDLPPATFTLNVPERFVPMTIEELRSIGPLRERK
jgi:acylphosphatase